MVVDYFRCDAYEKRTFPVLYFAHGVPEAALTCEIKVKREMKIHMCSLITV